MNPPTEASVRIGQYLQLRDIAWSRHPEDQIAERDALGLYERNWRFVDEDRMSPEERAFLQRLVEKYGNGVLHV